MSFTNSQTEAIRIRGAGILVSAGAGSGKTRVLTERLMEYIAPQDSDAEPVNIDSFLVITFTRAAAGELRARITAAITERLQDDPSNPHLRRQIALCRNAHIGTIHSFCADLLREYAGEVGISPSFHILEDEKSERLRAAALDRVLEHRYEQPNDDFLALVDTVGAGRDDKRLAELLLKIHSSLQAQARPEEWILVQTEQLDAEIGDIGETAWGQALLQEACEEVSFWLDRMLEALSDMETEEIIRRAYAESFSATAESLRKLKACLQSGWDDSVSCFPIPFPRINPIRNNPDPDFTNMLKSVREQCKKSMEKLSRVFSTDSSRTMADLRRTVPAMRGLLALTKELETEFRYAKRRANALDFSDLEHYAIRILTNDDGTQSDIAQQVASRYTEIMVDEYQDVSRVQDRIFHAVSRSGSNLFFVGDLKQSIYRFRLADPGIFTEKRQQYAENRYGERVIHMQENFRSTSSVLNAVNDVFLRCMSASLGDLEYGAEDMLLSGTPDTGDSVMPELLLLTHEEGENTDIEAEARMVAGEIKQLIQTALVREENKMRPVHYGDIAVLLRSANAVGPAFRRVFLENGIPVKAGAGSDFYGSVEVSEVFSMLSLIDNPHRDIPLISVLSSSRFGLEPDQLSLIRAGHPDGDYYTALLDTDDPAAKEFIQILSALRDEAVDLNPVEIVDRVIEKLDLWALCSAMPDGEQRMQHLMDLLSMAERFQAGGEAGLHRFVQWLENMEKTGKTPDTCTAESDAVQIMSIHRSKGLEFPVVFCSALGRQFNRQDTRDTVLIHPKLGLGPKVTDVDRKIEYPTAARRAIEMSLSSEMLSEEMRLLYVAMTRAKDRLVMTACMRKIDEQLEEAGRLCRYSKIPSRLLKKASCPAWWLLPSALAGNHLKLRIYRNETDMAVQKEKEIPREKAVSADRNILRKLEKNLSWKYPYAKAERLPSKITATELKTREESDPDAVQLMKSSDEETYFEELMLGDDILTPTRRGTAIHLLLQQIDLHQVGTLEGIKEETNRLLQQKFLTAEEASGIQTEKIYALFTSGLGKRMLAAGNLWREFRFSLLTEAGKLIPGETSDEKVLLQGVVDCCFEEEGSLVLVDYKTDHVKGEQQIMRRAMYYRVQLETYAGALERIFEMPVKEKLLYFLYPEQSVTV